MTRKKEFDSTKKKKILKFVIAFILIIGFSVFLAYSLAILYRIGVEKTRFSKFKKIYNNTYLSPNNIGLRRFELENKLYSNTFTSNHTHEFLVQEGMLYYKKINDPITSFTPFFYEDFEKHKVLEVSADGCNLLIMTDDYKLSYRKIIQESRKTKQGYIIEDLTERANWFHGYNSFEFFNAFSQKLTSRPPFQYAISQRGLYNHFIVDKNGKQLYEAEPLKWEGGTTSIFVLDENNLVCYDPMVPKILVKKFKTPFKYQTFKLTTTSSRLFVCGKNKQSGFFEIWFRTIDYDILGFLPFCKKYKSANMDWVKSSHVLKDFDLKGFKAIAKGENVVHLQVWGFNTKTNQFIKKVYKYVDFSDMLELQ